MEANPSGRFWTELRRKMHDPVAGNLPLLKRFRRQVARYWRQRWDSAADGGPPGTGWGHSSITGYPYHMSFIRFQTRAFTPAAVRRHIQSKNRVRYVASRIMWRPAGCTHGINETMVPDAT